MRVVRRIRGRPRAGRPDRLHGCDRDHRGDGSRSRADDGRRGTGRARGRGPRGPGSHRGRPAGRASRGDRGRRQLGNAVRIHRGRARLDHAHDQPLPLRPGVVEHPGRLHQRVDRGPARPLQTEQRLRPGGRAPGDGPPRAGVQVRPRRGRLPQALLRRPPRGPRRPAAIPRRGPGGGDGRHLQRAEHQPHRAGDRDPELRARHRLSARRARGRASDGVAAGRVRPRPAVPGDGRRRRADLVVVGAWAAPPVGADGRLW